METEKNLENGKTSWLVKWDFMKLEEPNGLDSSADTKMRESILKALDDGFEPFAVIAFPKKLSPLRPDVIASQWVYFKRPSAIKEAIDETPKVLT